MRPKSQTVLRFRAGGKRKKYQHKTVERRGDRIKTEFLFWITCWMSRWHVREYRMFCYREQFLPCRIDKARMEDWRIILVAHSPNISAGDNAKNERWKHVKMYECSMWDDVSTQSQWDKDWKESTDMITRTHTNTQRIFSLHKCTQRKKSRAKESE